MFTRVLFFLLILVAAMPASGQQDTVKAGLAKAEPRHVRISLMTVGQGAMLWEAFGHSCIRVIDSSKTGKKHDIIYNYGTFDNFDQDFVQKMLDGTLLYYLSVFPYDFFTSVFVEKGRSIEEQVLLLNDEQRTTLVNNLEYNALPKNKYYQYDFFTDNCSTRIFEIVSRSLGKGFVPAVAIPKGAKASFYEGSYQYYQNRHWERTGVAILFEHQMSKTVTNDAVMFLPIYLSKAFDGATADGKRLCAPIDVIAADTLPRPDKLNGPFIFTCIIALLTIMGLSIERLSVLGKIMTVAVLFMSGFLGCVLLYAWLGTDHKGCEDNLNLLWALPLNLVVPFLKRGMKAKYAIAGIALIGFSILLHLLKVTVLPIFEITPFLLSLVWVFAMMYRRNAQGRAA
jgi:hypothetical protein